MQELTDDGFALLGNALVLSYSATSVVRRQSSLSKEEYREGRREVSERRQLRDTLMLAGCYDYRLEHRDGYWATAPQSMEDYENWILEFLRGVEDIQTVRLKDFDIPRETVVAYALEEAMGFAEPHDLRVPISRLAPSALTRSFMRLVLDYFRGELSDELVQLVPGSSIGQLASTDCDNRNRGDGGARVSTGQRRYNRGFDQTDEPFVQEGVRMVRSGQAPSALAASRQIVSQYGTVTFDKWQQGDGRILTNAPENTAERLARKISKHLKRRAE